MTYSCYWIFFMSTTKRKRKDFTWADLDELLRYEPHTGKLIWRTNKHSKSVVPNTVAGCINKATGYRSITIFGVSYAADRHTWRSRVAALWRAWC